MKVRKLLTFVLCAALGLGMLVPAMAAADVGSDQELMAVTAKVKEALGLDTEIFTDFQGWANEDVLLGKRWNLEWSGDGVGLSITADPAGKIYSYNRSESVADTPISSWYFGGKMNIPRLPQDKSAAAFQAAKDFLVRVLEAPVESIQLDNHYAPSLHQSTYRYSGTVLLNNLPSPVTCSVSVRASDLTVTRFWRNDQSAGYLGGVPDAPANPSLSQARRLLMGTVEMEPRFVLGEDGKTATVQYLPVYGDDYYVDAETGQLVNLTELRNKLWRGVPAGGAMNKNELAFDTAAAEEAPAASLTQAEKDGAAILAGSLSKEDLDRAVKGAWPEIGLDQYTLAGASYSIFKKDLPAGQTATPEDYDITCRLTYGKQDGQVVRNKYVTADAKTGELKSLSSSRWYQGSGEDAYRYTTNLSTAATKAEAVLRTFAGEHFAVMALKGSTDAQALETKGWEHVFRYQQKAGDWFYDGNSYTVGVDATDGTISRLSGFFDDDVTLVLPTRIITPGEAAEAYVDAMDIPLAYLEVPVSISLAPNDVMPLLKEAGYSYVLALKTGYTLRQPEGKYVRGVDAETGRVIADDYAVADDNALTYDDLEGHWVKTAAEELAVFSIGLRGGSLKPGDTLTQLDMIALLSSVEGYTYDPTTASPEETDWLYNHGYMLGLVTPETRNETKVITRGELVKLILDAAGYERLAGLTSIFRCTFSDSGAIADSDIGYAALAQGFGLVKGGSDGAYAAGRDATRAEAIAMLYQYMK